MARTTQIAEFQKPHGVASIATKPKEFVLVTGFPAVTTEDDLQKLFQYEAGGRDSNGGRGWPGTGGMEFRPGCG